MDERKDEMVAHYYCNKHGDSGEELAIQPWDIDVAWLKYSLPHLPHARGGILWRKWPSATIQADG
jgi:hypothetical protein